MSGAQCGTYMIQPKQMNVNYPSNVDDHAINSLGNYAQPLEVPTDMTYSIFRIDISIVFREIVDAAWDAGCELDELPYDLVLDFDKKLSNLLLELDKKFDTFESNSSVYSEGIQSGTTDQKMAILMRQRDMAHLGIHNRFSRLHRPHLVRGAQDPRYAYSRMVCLRSARTVIELGKVMAARKEVQSLKIWSVNHHIFVSTIILVIDYCFNRDEPRAKERKEEILDCFRLLESRNEESTMATRGLKKLRDILRKGSTGRDNRVGGKNSRPGFADDEVATDSSKSQNFQTSGDRTDDKLAGSIIPTHDPKSYATIGEFNETSFQDQWLDTDYSFLENINFDVDMDVNQFLELF
jgi:hypothetical protein